MNHGDDEVKTWVAEWRIWAVVSAILVAAWMAWCFIRASFDTFWPLGIIVVWAVVLLTAPLWPSHHTRDGSSGQRRDGPRDA